jgi:L-ascorbate metabolism protein UlaG (beta-lactamase superfamily)
MNLLVDPVMHDLTFGVPSLIRGQKKILNGPAVLRQLGPSIHHLLISQGFDDHCQPESMQAAAALLPPSAKVVAPPSAAGVLSQFFPEDRLIYLSPGQSCVLEGGKEGGRVTVTATTGDTLGPPWQAPENGYLLRWGEEGGKEGGQQYRSLYYEPHCRYKVEEFEVREGGREGGRDW